MIVIFKCLDDLKLTRWAINVMPTLPFYAFGNVAILGDAVSLSCGVSDLNINKKQNTGACDDTVSRSWSRTSYRGQSPYDDFNSAKTYDVGCVNPGGAALKRAHNEDHSAAGARYLLAGPSTARHRSCKTFARKRGLRSASLARRAGPPRPLVLRAFWEGRGADTR